jgi:hypothetical protein
MLQAVKGFLKKFVRRHESWAIGIYESDAFLNLKPAKNVSNPVLTARDITDTDASFIADPFMIYKDDVWYMFFEVLSLKTNKGLIALATSPDGYSWTYQKVVLEEPFHLSYPYVFKWDQNYYMIPETHQAQSIRLYRALNFPYDWEFDKMLLEEADFVDASPFYFNEKWYMLASTTSNDHLRLYVADVPSHGWKEHPCSPIMENNRSFSRPSGRVLILNNRPVRFAQDDALFYGRQVYAFEITELTPTTYQECSLYGGKPILEPSKSGWNSTGMHHIDLHLVEPQKGLACVDAKGRDAIQVFGLNA